MSPMPKTAGPDRARIDPFQNWHPTLNGDTDPATIFRSSQAKFWWECPKHGQYQQSPLHRSRGHGCQVCGVESMAGTKAVPKPGKSVAEVYPGVVGQWNVELNGGLAPADVWAGSPQPRWWNCPQHGPYRQTIRKRAEGALGCGPCKRRPASPLAATDPDLVKEWHPDLNGDTTPADVSRGSAYKAWWVCDEHGAFQSQVRARAVQGSGCAKCALENRRPRLTLAHEHPDLAAQWHTDLNEDRTPQNTSRGSEYQAWWVCNEHGPYRMRVWARATCGQGCPKCGAEKLAATRKPADRQRSLAAASA